MLSLPTRPDFVTKFDPLDDVLVYGLPTSFAQIVSHLVIAGNGLPKSRYELLARYTAGCFIVATALTAYAFRRPEASGKEVALMLWLILGSCGAVVGALHIADDLRAMEVSEAMNSAYDHEDRDNVARFPSWLQVSVPLRRRG